MKRLLALVLGLAPACEARTIPQAFVASITLVRGPDGKVALAENGWHVYRGAGPAGPAAPAEPGVENALVRLKLADGSTAEARIPLWASSGDDTVSKVAAGDARWTRASGNASFSAASYDFTELVVELKGARVARIARRGDAPRIKNLKAARTKDGGALVSWAVESKLAEPFTVTTRQKKKQDEAWMTGSYMDFPGATSFTLSADNLAGPSGKFWVEVEVKQGLDHSMKELVLDASKLSKP
jgi:hypothetical protein